MHPLTVVPPGKRVIFEDHDSGYNHPAHGDPVLVFASDLWKKQFGGNDITPFPECAIQGDTGWYNTELVRALDNLGSNYSILQHYIDW